MKKILNILLGVILLITVILTVYAMVAGGSNEAINLNVIVAAAYLIARGHTIEIPDVANGGFFPHPETVITEASILVTYVALGAAVLTAIFTEIYKAFK